MARIRTIKPEFPQSESMGNVSREARLCFILLWTICDDQGRGRGNARMLASLLYPYDEDAPALIDGWMAELEREGCVLRYSGPDGASYYASLNWLKHQKIDRPSKSNIPPPTEKQIREASAKAREDSRDSREGSSGDQGPRTKEGTEGPRNSVPSEQALSAPKVGSVKSPPYEPPEIEPDADDKTWLFSKATHFLAMTYDRDPGSFRSQIGKWLKDTGEDATKLRSLIEQAELNRIADPRAWITKAIQNTVKPAAAQSAEVSEHEFWRIKVAQYAKSKSKLWAITVDGPPPSQHPNNIPLDILEEFGFAPPKREGKSAPPA